jgi:DNA replication and repair protein RecF
MLADIRLKNFRSYRDDSFEFTDGVNIIVGPNASGKTNLLEAILVVARGLSYRAGDAELIMFNKPWARLDARVVNGTDRTIKIVRDGSRSIKTYLIDDKSYSRLTHNHTLPAVLFEPNHLLLLNGQPDMRRQYLDDLLEQTQPGYGSTRRHYKRIVSQRNTLLKKRPRDLEQQLFVWNVRLSELGGFMAKERAELTEKLNQKLGKLYKDIARSRTSVTATYHSTIPLNSYETSLLHRLEANLDVDIARGFTGFGPHRDDLIIRFDNNLAAETASRGEIRTALLAMKIFELQLVEEVREQRPLLLLDDVFSELDGKRRHALTDYLQEYQTFITTTDADVVMQNFAQSTNLIAL